jgi:hypothetical protein
MVTQIDRCMFVICSFMKRTPTQAKSAARPALALPLDRWPAIA